MHLSGAAPFQRLGVYEALKSVPSILCETVAGPLCSHPHPGNPSLTLGGCVAALGLRPTHVFHCKSAQILAHVAASRLRRHRRCHVLRCLGCRFHLARDAVT